MAATWPARGQQAPDFWDTVLKQYIDEAAATAVTPEKVAAIDADPASALRVQQDARLSATFATRAALSLTAGRLRGKQRAALAQTAVGASIGAWSAAGATTGIASGTDYLAVLDPFGTPTLNPVFTYAGGNVAKRGSTYPDVTTIKASTLSMPGGASELMTRKFFVINGATQFEHIIYGRGTYQTRHRYQIDGAWIDAAPSDGPTNDGQLHRRIVTLPDSGRHVVMLEASGYNDWFYGVRVPTGATITKHQTPKGQRMVILGDSQVEGLNGTANIIHNPLGFAAETARLLGVTDYVQSGIGSTGWLSSAGGTRPTFADRFQTDMIDMAPDIALLPMSQNDAAYTKAAIKAAMKPKVQALQAARPACLIVIVSNMQPQSGAGLTAIRDAGREVAAECGVFFIDMTAWLTGTGRVGATTGIGNRDVYISSDDSHMSDAGHQEYAVQIAAAIESGISPVGL